MSFQVFYNPMALSDSFYFANQIVSSQTPRIHPVFPPKLAGIAYQVIDSPHPLTFFSWIALNAFLIQVSLNDFLSIYRYCYPILLPLRELVKCNGCLLCLTTGSLAVYLICLKRQSSFISF